MKTARCDNEMQQLSFGVISLSLFLEKHILFSAIERTTASPVAKRRRTWTRRRETFSSRSTPVNDTPPPAGLNRVTRYCELASIVSDKINPGIQAFVEYAPMKGEHAIVS